MEIIHSSTSLGHSGSRFSRSSTSPSPSSPQLQHSMSMMAHISSEPPAPSYSHDPGSSSHYPFPLPPTKSRLAAPQFYEYPSSFEEDVIGMDPPSGPSAPPFEVAAATAPPSAPPLEPDEGEGEMETMSMRRRLMRMYGAVPSAPPGSGEDSADVAMMGEPNGETLASEFVGGERRPREVVGLPQDGGPVPESEVALSRVVTPLSSLSLSPPSTFSESSRRNPPDYLP